MNKGALKKFFKNFWFIVWKDESFKGWVFSIIFLLIVIKFIFFPVLNFASGTSLPLVIVESCSMYHEGNIFSNFDNWWEVHDLKYFQEKIIKTKFLNFPFKNGLNKGDILFVIGIKPEKVKIGDVIIFNAGEKNPIIHRVMTIQNENGTYFFSTMGDNNNGQLFIEKKINQNQLVGRPLANIVPYFGWVKLILFENSKSSEERGFCTGNLN
ncbi:signal peptidase I [Candidatus Pacearchaeota archaeon CG1_02_30_18]|nr:MAG: signal peptidase I [Candidatus Pacearchaeota archaeon CG1_02_30_18]PIN71208.1 MAG: signal peptidase I [Candidatus Pacearchaeota archaeon CG11_big_fil_rev_8_21_14_0_20_30_13]PIZ82050.1 MAG: signal peptidase I [Candidatus Pacearchaeota archaeon CG_4_10_14_0_2_um_filter_30_11]PJA71484.1 MAG: signal peptidase I [Candidatus Pacearchaeota archaeon CG_4_9_14_3_um_filter_30_11]